MLIWAGEAGGGAEVAALAKSLGCPAFHLPQTANGRGVADAWAAASDEESEPRADLAADHLRRRGRSGPERRAMAEQAESVLAIAMFGVS